MDFEENEEEKEGVTKWPFYCAALFIISLVIGFAYLHLTVNKTLDQWQLTTCILASGLASILVFIPHLIDRFLAIAFDPSNRKDEELHRKTYFDIKEMKSQLEAFSVKIDKVPTLVDKIVSDSQKQEPSPDPTLSELPNDLNEIKRSLMEKLKGLEELVVQTPLLPEPDPAVAQMAQNIPLIQNSIDSLSKEVQSLKKLVQTLPTEFPEPVVIEKKDPELVSDRSPNNVESDPLSDDSKLTKEEEDIEEEIIESDPAEETIVESSVETESFGQDTEESSGEVEIELEGQNEDEMEPPTPPNPALESSPEGQDQTIEDELDTNDETATPEKSQPSEESPDNTDVQEEPVIEELALELPDPAETLRKVDAILQETDPSDSSGSSISSLENKEISVPKTSSTGTTSVVANVMIGIGNKPYLRGEGPGLNWDEGVPMNFIEIGKWAWSPSRKNASLTVQLYRNDNDPDQSGKIEVKAGEKIEITPQFG
ncbi:hypothetical protein [Candidatus Seribacter sulfatis]|uniref:hypothetical protein n=1 Tax=Candidatus Seribacter sulfatis TaxID=3381756 RepID=UPI00389B1FE5